MRKITKPNFCAIYVLLLHIIATIVFILLGFDKALIYYSILFGVLMAFTKFDYKEFEHRDGYVPLFSNDYVLSCFAILTIILVILGFNEAIMYYLPLLISLYIFKKFEPY